MRSLGKNPSDAEVLEIIREADDDGNDQIDFKEFLHLMARKMKDTDTDEELNQGFKIFDQDGDNVISKEDLRKLMKTLGETLTEEELDDMINVADAKGDKKISFEEFTEVLQNK